MKYILSAIFTFIFAFLVHKLYKATGNSFILAYLGGTIGFAVSIVIVMRQKR